jgi:hypothetical protein
MTVNPFSLEFALNIDWTAISPPTDLVVFLDQLSDCRTTAEIHSHPPTPGMIDAFDQLIADAEISFASAADESLIEAWTPDEALDVTYGLCVAHGG